MKIKNILNKERELILNLIEQKGYQIEFIDNYKIGLKITKNNISKYLTWSNDINPSYLSKILKDKMITYSILQKENISVPNTILFYKKDFKITNFKKELNELKLPLVVKPNCSYASKGISLIKNLENQDEVLKSFEKAFHISRNLIVQEFISGEEISLICIKNKIIIGYKKFFDKPPISLNEKEKINFLSLINEIYCIFNCQVFSVDLIIKSDGRFTVLEINSSPTIKNIINHLPLNLIRDYHNYILNFKLNNYGSK